ncbi:pectate lyase a [Moniliophthora roreri MCA 2997]|uniref:Pectate lyase a n=1 Tax=Moniliophthora roreri (strain MCA 2997) TaxID=1381753 RepID=V2XIU2_MONRO|nr:pectate lyase a [Moniliophthora roreri MCA 2997]
MKWFASIVAFIAVQAVAASPTRFVQRASVGDTATVGFATGTTGGSGGTQTTLRSLSELQAAVSGDAKKIVIVNGNISGDAVIKVGSNTSVLGAPGATFTGIDLRVIDVTNVIIRNVKVNKVLAPGDNVGAQAESNVLIGHDHYDGLLDITHGCTGVTVSNSYLHDHYKTSLVGHSDSNESESEDVNIRVAYVGNYWKNLDPRAPSFRFGTGPIYKNYFKSNNDGINTRVGAQLLVENDVCVSPKKSLYSTDEGCAVATGNDFGGGENTAPEGTFTFPPYEYSLLDTSEVVSSVTAEAGANLTW